MKDHYIGLGMAKIKIVTTNTGEDVKKLDHSGMYSWKED
jgi:hypothetical protein